MKFIKDKEIAIVGGGPGGLTLARLLQLNGANVKVYERDFNRTVRVQGATLDLHEESGLKALEHAGLMEAFRKNFRPGAGRLRIMDKHAVIKMDDHVNADAEENRPEIDRGPLRTILLDSLQPGTVVWDSHFIDMKEKGSGWQLRFKNGTEARADIVIAADGGNSRIRPLITPVKPFYAGITVIEGTVYHANTAAPRIHQVLKGGKLFAFGDEKSLIVSSKGDGSFAFYTGCKTEEEWVTKSGIDFNNRGQVIRWFKNEFTGWDTSWLEIFENADPHFIPRPQYCMPASQSWTSLSNLTMLGDAAHLMPPYAGEGVNMAMLDALELSNCLLSNQFSGADEAIAHYEINMRSRAAETIAATLESTEILHAPDAIPRLIEMFGGAAATTY